MNHYRTKNGPKPNLADNKPAVRTCLGCEKEFASLGPANRFCAPCKRKRDGTQEFGRVVQDPGGR